MGLLSRASSNTPSNDQAAENGDGAVFESSFIEDAVITEGDISIELEIIPETGLAEEEDAAAGVQELTDEEVPAENETQETKHKLDEMGKALSERIRRLPRNNSTPYTALSLLKAYGAFKTGICLTLKDSIYTSYTSVGFGVDKISIPQEKIWSEEKSCISYFKYDSGENLGIHTSTENLRYWIFPICNLISDPPKPWENVMILGALDQTEVNSAFNPESISSIITEIADQLLLKKPNIAPGSERKSDTFDQSSIGQSPEEQVLEEQVFEEQVLNEPVLEEPVLEEQVLEEQVLEEQVLEEPVLEEQVFEEQVLEEQGSEEPSSEELSFGEPCSQESGPEGSDSLKEKIAEYNRIHPDFNCILLDIPETAEDEEKAGFCKTVSKMLTMTGTVLALPNGCPLILLPKTFDRELIAHRLSTSFKTKLLGSFEAEEPEEVFNKIKSLL